MYVIGRGRYAREAYPNGGAGSALAAIVPLSRQRFIDGDTTQPGHTGSAAEPFSSIAQFFASRGDASVADATANYVGWVTPSLAGYVGDIQFPPYVSTELRADSVAFAPGSSTVVTGNAIWVNAGGAIAADVAAVVMHNITVTGSFTVTDDGGAPISIVVFGGDEVGGESAQISNGFVSNTTTHLATVLFENAVVNGGINAGASSDSSALVVLYDSMCNGDLSAQALSSVNAIFTNTGNITVWSTALFRNARFVTGTSTVLDAPGGAEFDGPSWRSFAEAGGSRAAGTFVLVNGGYNAGAVEGAALPTTGVNTDVSLNGTGATAGYTGENSGNHYSSSGLAADGASVTLKTGGGELEGDTLLITKIDLTEHNLEVKNNAGVTIGIIPLGERGFVLAQFSATASDWVFAEGGSLAG